MQNQTESPTAQTAARPDNLIYTNGGDPFKSLATVLSAISKKNLDPKIFVPVPVGKDEFAIGKLAVEPSAAEPLTPAGAGDQKEAPQGKYVETYWWVKFHAKSNPIDPDDVQQCVNGEVLQAPREVETIMPNRFLLGLDAAVIPKFTQMPGKPRKYTAKVRKFPYDRLRESSEKEYREWKNRHTRKHHDDVRRYGYDVTPEMVEDTMR